MTYSIKKNNSIRLTIAEIIHKAKDGHIPSAYSIVELLSVLYGKFLKFHPKDPDWKDRDYFILSKGHGSVAMYLILAQYGFITKKDLDEKGTHHGKLGGHPDWTKIPGIEASTGSLGHGFPIAVGLALGLRILKKQNRVITLIGDGESNEGTVWEAALVAPSLQLGNLCVIVDNNRSTTPILPIPQMRQIWEAFGWETYEIDGHNEKEIEKTFNTMSFTPSGRPKVIIANTIKGRGVSFMEGQGAWHSRVPTLEELNAIRKELST